MQLFGETIDSRDICQGTLGDCWLLAAMACLSEHKGAIHSIFRTKERNPKGKYRLRLYDGQKEKWENIVIDDYIPCDKKQYAKDGTCQPLFSQNNGNELYAILLEKAFAKFCGSYAALEGGQTIWAVRAMTGDPARQFIREEGSWVRYDLRNTQDEKDKRKCGLYKVGEKISDDMMFEVLLKYHKLGSVLTASGASGEFGLVTGHAYSILEVQRVNTGIMGVGGETFKMVKVRNPWGTGEWTGDWSDKSNLWDKHSSVARSCNHNPKGDTDDGAFWMSWEDYVKNWERIGVIDRTIDINSLGLTVFNDSACSPIAACIKGCCRFWCCCQGFSRLYCPHRSSEDTVKVGGCFGFCQKSAHTSPT
jgi:calpain-15